MADNNDSNIQGSTAGFSIASKKTVKRMTARKSVVGFGGPYRTQVVDQEEDNGDGVNDDNAGNDGNRNDNDTATNTEGAGAPQQVAPSASRNPPPRRPLGLGRIYQLRRGR